jgi:hypothetical protein
MTKLEGRVAVITGATLGMVLATSFRDAPSTPAAGCVPGVKWIAVRNRNTRSAERKAIEADGSPKHGPGGRGARGGINVLKRPQGLCGCLFPGAE